METLPYQTYRKGVMFIRYSYDLIRDIGDFEKLSMEGVL
jgi:hypothetical protein